ncbi:ribosome biogenesis protein SLX9-domain-containing protein [Bombardia bombarda]|uniref:Ribosome biogenesis protein SLX9 n=1 Tax=Bombardia bombarda TaxID=252184 RepID=A0AA40C4U2_9PEZI|nr:ribosome biogenesis protein SLX9-domain-containing protein [Bombardia bombarda]
MAPTAPPKESTGAKRLTAREKTRLRLADPLLPRKLHRPEAVVSDAFINSKRDKRVIKHSSFVSRIAKSAPGGSSSKALNRRRRRPSRKLVATLASLGDALDDISDEIRHDEETGAAMDAEQAAQGKVRHRSLKSRPGALKRKEKVVKGEMARFGRSLAQLSTVYSAVATGTPPVVPEVKQRVVGTAIAAREKEAQEKNQNEMEMDTTGGRDRHRHRRSSRSQPQRTGGRR